MDGPFPQRRRGGTLYMPFPAKNAPSPEDEKAPDVVRSKSRRYTVGSAEMKGRRPTMEDASVVHGCFGGKDDCDLFCVFDGHGSRHSAAYCAQHLPDRLVKKLKDGVKPDTALHDSFIQVADELKPTSKGNGTTAAVALIIKKKLWVANVGDSRVVLCRGKSSAIEAREKENKKKEEEKEAKRKEKERLEKEKKEKENVKKEEGGGGGGKRPMGKRERSCSKSLCVDRNSSPHSGGPSSPHSGGSVPSPTRLPSSSSSSNSPLAGRENDENLSLPSSSGPSSSSRKRPHTFCGGGGGRVAGGGKGKGEKNEDYDSDEDSNEDSACSDPFASEGEGEGKKEKGGEYDSDEDSNDDSACSDPFASEGEGEKKDNKGGEESNDDSACSDPFASDGEGSNDDSACSDPFASDGEGSNDDSACSDPFASEEGERGGGGEDSNDDSACSDPFASDGEDSNDDSACSDPFASDGEDVVMSDEEEDPIPEYMAARLSYDHRPDSVSEQERIKGLGGFIVNGRVAGQLAVTRAIGDSQLFPFVSPEPYISVTELRDDDEFIVIACDGLFDVFPDDVVVTIARGEKDPEKASERLTRQAFGAGSTDNISTIVVRLLK